MRNKRSSPFFVLLKQRENQQISKAIGIRLTKAKLAQAIPIIGLGIGGEFNAYYTDKITKAANYLYRERFLAAKYGASILDNPTV